MSEHPRPATNSCHQALAFVLKWQWSKHLAITDIQAPDAIRVFCGKCDACTNARDCNALDVLESWAREQSEKCKAGEALPPGLSGAVPNSQLVPTTHSGSHPSASSSAGMTTGTASHGAAAAPPVARRAASTSSTSSSSDSTSGE